MENKKITNKMLYKFLRINYERYLKKYGEGSRNLEKFHILVTGAELYKDEMPELLVYEDGCGRRSLLPDIIIELESKKLIRNSQIGFFSDTNEFLTYIFTDEGYELASKGRVDRLISYFNDNPGLALPVSLFSLFVSIIAIVVSVFV